MNAPSRMAPSGRSRRFAVCRHQRPSGGPRAHLVAMVLTLASTAAAHAETVSTGFFRGTIRGTRPGGLEVAMSLCTEGRSVSGSYFYFDVGTDIALRGTLAEDGSLALEETSPKGVVTGRWNGRFAETFKGTWTPPKGTALEFELTRLGGIPADPAPGGAGARVERRCSDIGYRMARTGKRRDYFPRLVRFRDKAIMADVNSFLEEMGKTWFDEIREDEKNNCSDREPAADPETDVGVEYASHDVFSIRAVGYFGCWVSNLRDDSVTYDLRTGVPAVLEDLFREGMSWDAVIRLLFAAQVAQAAKGDECYQGYNAKYLVPYRVAYHIAADGLVVAPREDGVASDIKCWQRTVVPFAVLRAAARSGSVLERAAAAAPAGAPVRYRIRDRYRYRDEDLFFDPTPAVRP